MELTGKRQARLSLVDEATTMIQGIATAFAARAACAARAARHGGRARGAPRICRDARREGDLERLSGGRGGRDLAAHDLVRKPVPLFGIMRSAAPAAAPAARRRAGDRARRNPPDRGRAAGSRHCAPSLAMISRANGNNSRGHSIITTGWMLSGGTLVMRNSPANNRSKLNRNRFGISARPSSLSSTSKSFSASGFTLTLIWMLIFGGLLLRLQRARRVRVLEREILDVLGQRLKLRHRLLAAGCAAGPPFVVAMNILRLSGAGGPRRDRRCG